MVFNNLPIGIRMIQVQFIEAGYCRHCERMTLKTGLFKQRQYPSTCALIKHPTQGYILFDTGYSDSFFQLTKKFPFSLYRYLTPVTLKKTLKDQLLEQNIQATDINYIVISHFHSDHVAALSDFPNAKFICHPDAVDDIRNKSKFRALLQGFLPGLLPHDFYERLIVLKGPQGTLAKTLYPFTQGYDIFGDQQLIAIDLPGHAKGHIGLLLRTQPAIFLVADSCWHRETYQDLIYPSKLTYLVHDNKTQYLQTIEKLHQLHIRNRELQIIPTHCEHTRKLCKVKELC